MVEPTDEVPRGTSESADDARRAALIQSIPAVDESTPLAAQIAADAQAAHRPRRAAIPAATADQGADDRQPEGWRRQDEHRRQRRRRPRAGRPERARDRQRPAGQRVDGTGRHAHSGTPSIYEVLVDDHDLASVVQAADGVPRLWCAPATIDLSGAEIELVSLVARENRLRNAVDAYLEHRARAARSASTTSSSTAPPASGCSRSTPSSRRARCSSRSSASTTRSRA